MRKIGSSKLPTATSAGARARRRREERERDETRRTQHGEASERLLRRFVHVVIVVSSSGRWQPTSFAARVHRRKRLPDLFVVCEERPQELVERLAVAAGDGGGRERADGRRARDVHRERDLAEVVARPQDAPRTERAHVADREQPGEDDVEAVSLSTLEDGRLAGGYLF